MGREYKVGPCTNKQMSLDLIKNEEIGKKIEKKFNYTFEVEQNGVYVIIVSARAKSWWQNTVRFISFFNDDNLALKIN